MIDSIEKSNRQLAFELQNSHVCEKRSKVNIQPKKIFDVFSFLWLLSSSILLS